MNRWKRFACSSFVALYGCSAGGSSRSLVVGSEGTGGAASGPSGAGGALVIDGDAGASRAFSAHIESPRGMTVTFVTLSCSRRCADVLAVAKDDLRRTRTSGRTGPRIRRARSVRAQRRSIEYR